MMEAHEKQRSPHNGEEPGGHGRLMTPLQMELMEDGIVPEPDVLGISMRPDLAPEIGYGEEGPEPLFAPDDVAPQDRYEGLLPVFQWEIDPQDPSLEMGEERYIQGDWEYEVWWQRHPAGLRYVSIQALDVDRASGDERPHPMGRNVIVNLVYDEKRQGVVAIYGTARDFRPFVEAFRVSCEIPTEEK